MPSVLQKQLVTVPLAGGIDAKSDPLVVQTSSMLQVSNGVFTDVGGVRKRPGNSAASSVLSAADPATVFSIGPLIGAASARQTSVLQPNGTWANAGTAETGEVTARNVLLTTGDIFAMRSDLVYGTNTGARLYVAGGARTLNPGSIYWVGPDNQTTLVFSAAGLGAYTSSGTGTFVIFPQDGTTAVKEVSETTGAVTAGAAQPGAARVPFDAVALDATRIAVAYRTAAQVTLYVYDITTHTFTGNVVTSSTAGAATTWSIQLAPLASGQYTALLAKTAATTGTLEVLSTAAAPAVLTGAYVSYSGVSATLVADPTSANKAWHVWTLVGGVTANLVLNCNKAVLTGAGPYTVPYTLQSTRTLDYGAATASHDAVYSAVMPLRPLWSGTTLSHLWLTVSGGDVSKLVRFSSTGRITGSALGGIAYTAYSADGSGAGAYQKVPGIRGSSLGLVPTSIINIGVPATLTIGGNTFAELSETFSPTLPPCVVQETGAVFSGSALPQTFCGVDAHEQGFVLSPGYRTSIAFTLAGGPALTTGQTYTWAFTYEYINSAGLLERSAPSRFISAVATNTAAGAGLSPIPTNRVGASTCVYRTAYLNSVMSSQMYLVATVADGTTQWSDTTTDATAATQRPLYSQAELPEDAPPPMSKLARWQGRLIGIETTALNPTMWFTKPIESGIAPAWNADSILQLPASQGALVGMAPMDDKLVLFQSGAVSYITGNGPDATGAGSFNGPFLLVGSTGCSNAQSILKVDDGVWYQDGRGLCFLDRGLSSSDLGAAVESFVMADTITAAIQISEYDQYHWYMGFTTLVYDCLVKRWSTFPSYPAVSAITYDRVLYRMLSSGLLVKDDTSFLDQGSPYQMTLQTAWAKPLGGPQGYQRVYKAGLLGRWLNPHTLTLQVDYDYVENPATVVWDPTANQVAAPLFTAPTPYQVRWQLPRQKCESIRFTFTTSNTYTYFDSNLGHDVTINVADACALSSLVLEFGVLPGINRLPSAQSV